MNVIGKTPRELDQFFTKPELALQCVNDIENVLDIRLNEFDLIVEPSAGNGAFVDVISAIIEGNDCEFLYMDIDSKDKKFRHDFLKRDINNKHSSPKRKRCITIGNPPFGKNSSVAIQFFNKASTFSDVIAFILPRTFCKVTVQNKLDQDFFQVYENRIPETGFTFQGKSYNVPCVFQIWVHTKFVKSINQTLANWESGDKRPIIPSISETHHFKFVKNSDNPDLVIRRVGVYAGKMYLDDPENHTQQNHLFLKRKKNTISKQELIKNIKNLDLENADFKYDTAGMPCINKSELSSLYLKTYNN